MNRFFQALLSLFFSHKKRNSPAYPYRTLFVPDDVPPPPKDPWYGGFQKDFKSFGGRVKTGFDRSLNQIERLIPIMTKLFYLAIFFGCILSIGMLRDINDPTNLGLRWAAGICCAIMAIGAGVVFFDDVANGSRR